MSTVMEAAESVADVAADAGVVEGGVEAEVEAEVEGGVEAEVECGVEGGFEGGHLGEGLMPSGEGGEGTGCREGGELLGPGAEVLDELGDDEFGEMEIDIPRDFVGKVSE